MNAELSSGRELKAKARSKHNNSTQLDIFQFLLLLLHSFRIAVADEHSYQCVDRTCTGQN